MKFEVTQLMCTDFASQDLETGVEAVLTQRCQRSVLCSDITALSFNSGDDAAQVNGLISLYALVQLDCSNLTRSPIVVKKF